eukprot:3866283-Amphidinium_carterae.2
MKALYLPMHDDKREKQRLKELRQNVQLQPWYYNNNVSRYAATTVEKAITKELQLLHDLQKKELHKEVDTHDITQ